MRLDFKAWGRCRTPSVHCQETLVAFRVSFHYTRHSLVEGRVKRSKFLATFTEMSNKTDQADPGCSAWMLIFYCHGQSGHQHL